MLRTLLLLAAIGCFSLVALAQPIDKKGDAIKGKEDDKIKAKEPDKGKPPEKKSEAAKLKTPIDGVKLPKDAIVIVLDNAFEAASLFAKSITVSLEEWQNQQERIKALERQLKPDRKVPYSCKLTGELEGDFLVFRGAEFIFSTEAPNTLVVLGLQGAHLLNVGDLDGQVPFLNFHKDDGFFVQVEKQARPHKLTLSFRVPVQQRKSPGGVVERGIDLGLAGFIVTNVNLRLPPNIKDLRSNDLLEKPRSPGVWELGLPEKSKTLGLTWKEPVAQSGNAPLVKAEAHIKVDIDATHVNVGAELILEDKRPQTKEWRLLLPKQAKVKPPADFVYEPPTEKTPYHVLRAEEATSERQSVSISYRVPRATPGARTALGPFHVLGAFQQSGTINVKMPAEVALGQRLVHVRGDGTYEILQVKNGETEAAFSFRYLGPVLSDKNWKLVAVQKPPLELEWRFEKNQLETEVVHLVNLRTVSAGFEIDVDTEVQLKALFAGINTVDLKLPMPQPRGAALAGTAAPGLGFPGVIPWPGAWKQFGSPGAHAPGAEFIVMDKALDKELSVTPIDATGKVRVFLDRTPAPKEVRLVVRSKMSVPAQTQRVRLELPRPLGTQERGAALKVKADQHIELLDGPPGAEVPAPDRSRLERSWEQSPPNVDIAWRPFHREAIARAEIDVTVFESSAQVLQTLRFPADSGLDTTNQLVSLKVPAGIRRPQLVTGKIVSEDESILRIQPGDSGARREIVLEYDLPITKMQVLQVTPIWPVAAARKEVKVRIWAPSLVKPRLTEDTIRQGHWKERGIEAVVGKEGFPALVLHGTGGEMPLALKIEWALASSLAAFVADRALIQVRERDDGSHDYRTRYHIQKLHASHLDIELPVALALLHEPPVVRFGPHKLRAEALDKLGKVLRVQLPPERRLPAVLELSYAIGSDDAEGNGSWQTVLRPPVFRAEVLIAQMRWQLSTPAPSMAGVWGRFARADVRWGMQGGLPTPQSALSEAGGEAWLIGKEAIADAADTEISFALVSQEPQTIYHWNKRWWLLGCSGLLLIVVLGVYLSPLPRFVFGILIAGFIMGGTALAQLAPTMFPPVLFGAQPGLALILIVIGAHWLLQERQRRSLESVSGFSQAKPNSTMIRTNVAKRPREASTVDAPVATENTPAPQDPA